MLAVGSLMRIQARAIVTPRRAAFSRSLLQEVQPLSRWHHAAPTNCRHFRCIAPYIDDKREDVPKLVPIEHTRAVRSSRSWKPEVNSNFWQKVVGVGAAGYATVKVLPGLKFAIPLLKVAKVGPLLSMVASGFAYGAVFGWSYGFGMIFLIVVHETGHALMMRYLGVPVGPMVFIPFLGASVIMEDHPQDAAHEAAIALAGPVLGSLAAFVPLGYGLATGSQLGFALAHWGFMINLFNLMPLGNMDGGRVAGALSKWLLPVGVAGCASLLYTNMNPILLIITLLGTYTTFQRFWNPPWRPFGYYDIPRATKILVGGTYLGLITALVYAMQINDRLRKPPQDLLDRNSSVRRQLDDVDRWI